jgi:hypothetical protein
MGRREVLPVVFSQGPNFTAGISVKEAREQRFRDSMWEKGAGISAGRTDKAGRTRTRCSCWVRRWQQECGAAAAMGVD